MAAAPRRRGRRRLFADSTRVLLLLDARVYDRLYAVARTHDLSVPEVIRRAVNLVLRNINSPPPPTSGTVAS